MFQQFLKAVFVLLLPLSASAQGDYHQPVTRQTSGGRVYTTLSPAQLQQSLDTLFARGNGAPSGSSTQNWNDVLSNGSNPGMDIDFNAYDITELGSLTSTGTLAADSLTLNKDADITGRLSVTNVVSFGDSLSVSGYVTLADSLEVVEAVMVGQTLQVTGITSLGDSLHVIGNVDFDALFHVDGAATFGSTLTVSGESTLNDSLHVNGGADIAGTLTVDSLSVTDVINGQVSSLGNHTTDDLAQGTTNLFMTSSERELIQAMAHAIDSLLCTPVEHQGVVYEVILIGEQCWFAENLRCELYADGTSIQNVTNISAWSNLSTGAQCVYSNDVNDIETSGLLYNWYAVEDERGLCPSGWHLPTDAEWTVLTDHLGGEGEAGDKMKHSPPAWDGSNSSGFSGLPVGYRNFLGYFNHEGIYGYWWSTTPFNNNAMGRRLSESDGVVRNDYHRKSGFSVRCVRD